MLPKRPVACLVFWVLLALAGYSVAAPTVGDKDVAEEQIENNKTTTATESMPEVKPARIENADHESDISKDKTHKCVLQAFKVIVADEDAVTVLSPECQEILNALTRTNAHKEDRKIEDGEADLRRELKELTKKDAASSEVNEEMDQVQSLLNQKRVVQTDNLKEVNPGRDDTAILEMEAEKAATHGKPPKASQGSHTAEPPTGNESSFPARLLGEKLPGMARGDDTEIGVIEQPGGRRNINEDFLIIPLRYFLQEFLLGGPLGSNFAPPGSGSFSQGREGEAGLVDAKGDQWAMQSLLDQPDTVKDTQDAARGAVLGGDEIVDEPKRSDKNTEANGSDAFDVADGNQPADMAPGGNDFEVFSPTDAHKDGVEILALVEDDISKLGEDLRRLKFPKTE